jgi:hypothetical protein
MPEKVAEGAELVAVFFILQNGILQLCHEEERSEVLKNRQIFYDYKAANIWRFWWLSEFNCDVARNLIFRP